MKVEFNRTEPAPTNGNAFLAVYNSDYDIASAICYYEDEEIVVYGRPNKTIDPETILSWASFEDIEKASYAE